MAEGVLKLPQYSSAQTGYFGYTAVSNGATLFTMSQKPGGSTAITALRSLSGEGIVTNTVTPGSSRSGHSMTTIGYGTEASVFKGAITPPITLYLQSTSHKGQLTLLGTNSTYAALYFGFVSTIDYPESDDGVISFLTIGGTGSSSLGKPGSAMYDYLSKIDGKAVLRYLGNGGETTGRPLYLGNAGKTWFDAGAHGGITFTANWESSLQSGQIFYRIRRLYLTGSNETACVIKGDLVPFVFPSSSKTPGYIANTNGFACVSFPTFVTKRGTGVWRFGHRTSSKATGGFAIEQGTLQFESIAEKGEPCSLGLATQTTACDPDALLTNSAHYVDYAYTLGNPANVDDRPVFEYVGTTQAVCTTRPIVLVGGGGELRNSVSDPNVGLRFEGVSARDAGTECTFVLGGTNTSGRNMVSGISDGAGKVNVLKTGSGRWAMNSANTFSGNVHVADGTLELAGPRYTWFRFTVKEVAGWTISQAGTDNVYGALFGLTFGEVALYDKDGVRRNVGLTQPFSEPINVTVFPSWDGWYARDYRLMQEGQAEWDTHAGYFYNGSLMGQNGNYDTTKFYRTFDRRLDVLFDDNSATYGSDGWFYFAFPGQSLPGTQDPRVAEQRQPKLDNPDSWLSLVMRLPDNSPEICSYDLSSGLSAHNNRWPLKFSLEGSVDGRSWTMLDNNINYDADSLTNGHEHCWYSDLQPVGSSQTRTGFAVTGHDSSANPAFSSVASFSVGSNGVLQGSHGAVVSSVAIDAADAGKFKDLIFAAEGNLSITGSIAPGGMPMPAVFENVQGLDNLSGWTLSVNGRTSRVYKAAVSDGRLLIIRKGISLSFR